MNRTSVFARLLAILAGLAALGLPLLASATVEDSLEGLAGKKFSTRLAAVAAIRDSADPRAADILQAALDGTLHRRKSDRRFVISSGDGARVTLTDALTGDDAGSATKAELLQVRTNNRLRKSLRVAVAALELSHPEAARRLAAARELLGTRSDATAKLLRDALSMEQDTEVRDAMEIGLATMDIKSNDATRRLQAIMRLDGSLRPEVRGLLAAVIDNPDERDPQVKAAAAKILDTLDARLAWYAQLSNLYFGISLGSVLLLAAVGLAITFGVMGVINMAHGEMVMLGAYTTYVVQQLMPGHLEWSLLVALPAAFLVAGLVGILIERGVIRFLYGRPLETLLATFGISLILQQAVRTVFSPLNRSVTTPEWMSGAVALNPAFTLTYNRFYIIIFALLVLLALVTLLRYTRFGLEMRAVTQNRAMASSMGIRTARVDALTFGLGSGIAGLAGVALSQLTNVGPNMGQAYIVDSFMVVVFGGVGNLLGTFVGAMTLGVANKFLEPVTGAVLAKILVLIFIILFIQRRPRGLFALSGRAADA